MMKKRIKSFITGLSLALSKAEQGALKNIELDEDTISQEQQIRKSEIKVVSKYRFYDLQRKADRIIAEKYQDLYYQRAKQRGLGDIIRSFKNKRYKDLFEVVSEYDRNGKYKFKTSNNLYKYADSAYIKECKYCRKGNIELNFVINIEAGLGINEDSLSRLDFFEITENGYTYFYKINKFLGSLQSSNTEVVLKFEAIERITDEMENYSKEERVMKKGDLILPDDTARITF